MITNSSHFDSKQMKKKNNLKIAFSSKLSRNVTLRFRELKLKQKIGNSTSNHWLK
jgi:hypothetical protein